MMFSEITGVARSKTSAAALRALMVWVLAGLWVLCVTRCGNASTIEISSAAPTSSGGQAIGKAPQRSATQAARKGASERSAATPEPKRAVSPLPAEIAARPAEVSLKNGSLTIEADNSDLAQVLRNVASLSGMTISGLTRSSRIFGRYGPGDPRKVLTRLLTGSGYNFIMAGNTPDGAPRQLLLTAQSGPAPSAANPLSTGQVEPDQQAQPTSQAQGAASTTSGSAPAASAPADVGDAQQQREIRMQQILQRLQAMHEEHGQSAPE